MNEIVQPRDILKEARAIGARAAEVLYTQRSGFEVAVEEGTVVRRVETTRDTLSIVVWLDEGQMGRAKGQVKSWKSVLKAAQNLALTAEPNPWAGPAKGWATAEGSLGIDDLRYAQLDSEDKVSMILRAYQETRAAARTSDVTDFKYEDYRSRRVLANTKGVLLQEYGTVYKTHGSVAVPRHDLTLSAGLQARTFSSVGSLPFGVALANRMSMLLQDEVDVSGPIRVFWPPRVTAQVFALLAPYFTESRMGSGTNFLSKGRGKENYFDPRILMVDDGSLFGGLRTRSFDDRGAAPVPLTLIREGQIHRNFLSVQSARAADTRPTGHCLEGGWQPTNLQIRGGTRSLNALMSEMDETVFYIDHFRDLKRGLNMTTGKLNVLCSGRLMRKGKGLGAVRNVHLKGNLVDGLRQLVSLSSDTDRFGHVDAPGMVLDGFEISPR